MRVERIDKQALAREAAWIHERDNRSDFAIHGSNSEAVDELFNESEDDYRNRWNQEWESAFERGDGLTSEECAAACVAPRSVTFYGFTLAPALAQFLAYADWQTPLFARILPAHKRAILFAERKGMQFHAEVECETEGSEPFNLTLSQSACRTFADAYKVNPESAWQVVRIMDSIAVTGYRLAWNYDDDGMERKLTALQAIAPTLAPVPASFLGGFLVDLAKYTTGSVTAHSFNGSLFFSREVDTNRGRKSEPMLRRFNCPAFAIPQGSDAFASHSVKTLIGLIRISSVDSQVRVGLDAEGNLHIGPFVVEPTDLAKPFYLGEANWAVKYAAKQSAPKVKGGQCIIVASYGADYAACEGHAEDNGFAVRWRFKNALEAIRASSKGDTLLFPSRAKLGPLAEALAILSECRERGLTVAYAKGEGNSDSPMVSLLSDAMSALQSLRVETAPRVSAPSYTPGPSPFGSEDTRERLTVLEMVKMRNSGMSFHAIADALTAQGKLTKNGKAWFGSTVKRILDSANEEQSRIRKVA